MSHKGRQGRMSECSGATSSGAVILEEAEGPGASRGRGEGQAQDQGTFRCAVWPRQQTWLCVVPLLIGFIGLGLSLMLLKWIVVGTVRDYVPTDLVDANRIGQDPIFLSKPSGIPKGPDTTTTTTTPSVDGGNPTARTATVAKGRTRTTTSTTTVNSKTGGASGNQVTPRMPGNRRPSGFTTTVAPRTSTVGRAATPSSSPSNPTVLNDSTQMWTTEHTTTETVSTTPTTRSHGHRKTPSPTVPPVHSEHFKPCHERDLAYCLNGGECFVIETLTGPHKHCKCREGYQGIRCDQFLPKTDSILSDPNHLGIEFMENKEAYKRQVLSIISIAMAISLLGTLCMALYCRNRRRREKLQAHLKESRSLKNYTANNSHSALGGKNKGPNDILQMHEYFKRTSHHRHGNVCESSFTNCSIATAAPSSSSRGSAKQLRKSSLSQSPDQRIRASHWSASRRTPPIPRGRLNPVGGSKFSGPAYQHLQEVDATEKDTEPQKGFGIQGDDHCEDCRQDAFVHMQTPVTMETSLPLPWGGGVEVRSHQPGHAAPATRSLRRPGWRQGKSLPPPVHSCSIPIIPSVLCHHDSEASCMQTTLASATMAMSAKAAHTIGQDKGSLLPDEEHLRVLAKSQHEEGSPVAPVEARETVCFLNLNGGSGSMLGCSGPTQTQLLSPSLAHRDLVLCNQ
ncbi:pro-neuregulin-3, membrane-bound isoform [Gouania willdenowi]|uniref:pro-neuregulin-3, membrane-bound isoform n=1 Tax=Gouania willdenowi TaxID=441366 RepID=UPI001056E150|nr:pro-neuregulin-3, membrane-bound isoform-like [Gouania willdenowi]